MDKLLVGIPEAAKMLSISRSAIYVLLAERSIKSVKNGKRRLVVVSSLHSFIETLPSDGLAIPILSK
jgi:excisionase family DNA binding protein